MSLRNDLIGSRVVGSIKKHVERLASFHFAETHPIAPDMRNKILKISQVLAVVYDANLAAGEPIAFDRCGQKRTCTTVRMHHTCSV